MEKWKEEVEKLTSDINPIQRLVFMAWIQKEIIEKIVQDSKTMTHEELTTKWL